MRSRPPVVVVGSSCLGCSDAAALQPRVRICRWQTRGAAAAGGRVVSFLAFRIRHLSVLGEWNPQGPRRPLKFGVSRAVGRSSTVYVCGGAGTLQHCSRVTAHFCESLIHYSDKSRAKSPATPTPSADPAPLRTKLDGGQDGSAPAFLSCGVHLGQGCGAGGGVGWLLFNYSGCLRIFCGDFKTRLPENLYSHFLSEIS